MFKKIIFKFFCYGLIIWLWALGYPFFAMSLKKNSLNQKVVINFLNEQTIRHNFLFQKIKVGGLSALTYNPLNKSFFALSDDKGHRGPPRFYQLKLKKKFWTKKYRLQIKDQVFLKGNTSYPHLTLDPEGMAFLSPNQIFISSEGVQLPKKKLLKPPELLSFSKDGHLNFKWKLSSMFWPKHLKNLKKWGVRENKAFEALTIDPNKKFLYLATETSLKQDECIVQSTCRKQKIRISQFHIPTKKLTKQFVYLMPSIIKESHSLEGKNGLTDFVSLKNKQFLIIERAYLKNSLNKQKRKMDKNQVRLVLADCSKASNVMSIKRLNRASFIPCQLIQTIDLKKILPTSLDNIEGIVLGPPISSKQRLLILVSDNNFSSKQKTQFLFFNFKINKQTL